jgi:hypothetical protein
MAKERKRRPKLPCGNYKTTPYYAPEYCPKDPEENLRWRISWREKAITDPVLQRDFRQAAFEDVLFFFNSVCWCFEPRSRVKIRPFCTWTHQDPAIVAMDHAIDESEVRDEPIDVVIDKSRGQGATWMYLMIILRRWLRDDMFSAGLVTRNEKLVDSARDPDTLMWKICWAIHRLPKWMWPEGFDWSKHRNLNEHSLLNPANGASVVGYSATGDVARGGRKTLFCLDELAAFKSGEDYHAMNSTQHVTNCRFLVSTYMGDSGAYYDSATKDNDAIKLVMDWKDNPNQNAKQYRMVNGKIFEADPRQGNRLGVAEMNLIRSQHAKLKKRGFKVEGKLRNIWYNQQCLRPGATPRGIAQELDRDPHGSVSKVFDHEVLREVRESAVRPPLLQGRFIYDPETAKPRTPCLAQGEEGELKLWVPLDLNGDVPAGIYVIGVDIAAGTAGTYSSNSVACVINRMTGQQVAEWASNSVNPIKFAYLSVALCRWFKGAHLVPEANFGVGYMKTVVETIGYENMYYRDVDVVGMHKKTQKPGFWMANDDTKLKLFETMQEAMAEGAFTPRSAALLDECPEYEWQNGKIVHVGSAKGEDESGKGKAHGDRVIAASIGWMACAEEPVVENEDESPLIIPAGSMAERLQLLDAQAGQSGDPWEFSSLDIFSTTGRLSGDEW